MIWRGSFGYFLNLVMEHLESQMSLGVSITFLSTSVVRI